MPYLVLWDGNRVHGMQKFWRGCYGTAPALSFSVHDISEEDLLNIFIVQTQTDANPSTNAQTPPI